MSELPSTMAVCVWHFNPGPKAEGTLHDLLAIFLAYCILTTSTVAVGYL